MSLQVHKRSEELGVSKADALPYELNARANTQRKGDVKAMSEPVSGRVQPPVNE
jgi:hypothetical protein